MFEGDIVLRHPDVRQKSHNATHLHAIPEDGSLWTGNQLVYSLDFSAEDLSPLLRQAMQHITSLTGNCITFKERTFEDINYVNIIGGSG